MALKLRARVAVPTLLGAVALAGTLIPASVATHTARAASPIYLTTNQNFHATGFTKNWNPFDANQNDDTKGTIYEPLYVISDIGKNYPWLATGYAYSNGNKTLTVTLRHGVKWSDGQPFTAADVAFTFNYGKQYSAADQNGLWAGKYFNSVTAQGTDTVVFQYTKVNTMLLPNIVSNVVMLPQHVWSKVTNPDKYSDPNLVGTGPFANLKSFSTQEFILGKNPYYWQKIAYDGFRAINYLDNNGVVPAMVRGDIDWTGHLIPNTQGAYAAHDPSHYHFFYHNTNPLGIWFNNEKYPYSLVAFRKALSYAIDRKKVSSIAENGYELPAEATGIKLPFPEWFDNSLNALSTDLSTFNPAKAKATLLAAGFKYQGDQLMDPRGNKVSMTLSVPAGWSDWVLACRIIVQNFKAIGVDAQFVGLDQATWFTKSQSGQIDAHIHWTGFLTTPYTTFYSYMSKESFTPTGTDASLNGQNNWERYVSPEATSLLAQFRSTSDVAQQKVIAYKLEAIQLRDLPYIPVMHSANWYTYSTLHFTGWPTKDNFYVEGSPNSYPDRVVVMTRIHPV